MKRVNFALFLSTTLTLLLYAEQSSEFESLLDNVSDIATKKSINVDYMPSVVSVIDSKMLQDAGIQNITQALDMLPGFQTQLSPMGYTMTTVRGLKNPNAYLSDKMKILIDGVSINNEITGSSSFYLDFPIQLVEKIEVLRGPGSTTYGDGAIYATINIITKLGNNSKEDKLYLGVGSYGYQTVGANVHAKAGGWQLFSDGYYQKSTKSLYFESRNGNTDEAMEDFSVGFKAKKENLEFLTRIKKSNVGNFYGFENTLNPIGDTDGSHATNYIFSQLSYTSKINNMRLETKAKFSYKQNDVHANIYSVTDIANRFAVVGVDMQDGFYYKEKNDEQNYEVEALLALPKVYSNTIVFGAGIRQAVVTSDNFYSSVENAITANRSAILSSSNYDEFRYRAEKESAFWANPTTKLLPNDTSRTISHINFKDLVELNDKADLHIGLRGDHYSDFGFVPSKSLGVVYRATQKNIFKLLYGTAFRVPTFTEAYANGHINFRAGDRNLKPEESETIEAVAIYAPLKNHKYSLNAYYTKLKNIIDLEEYPNTDPGYRNYKDRFTKGVELEYNYRTQLHHNLYLNATYIDATYTIPPEDGEVTKDQSMPDISPVMLKGIYIYSPSKKLSFGTTWRYFSETTSTELQWVKNDDSYSPTTPAVHIFDETITYRTSSLAELRLSVKNLFGADVRNPSYYYWSSDNGNQREGRNFQLSYTQKF
ncbi:MAG: TonB-dependent receptor plug domain-containing protein [Helicobacteraceae bacterium]|nr:TonB-dependent receptor plug domain-containing protein [Helicobacteraceae bacterium]